MQIIKVIVTGVTNHVNIVLDLQISSAYNVNQIILFIKVNALTNALLLLFSLIMKFQNVEIVLGVARSAHHQTLVHNVLEDFI